MQPFFIIRIAIPPVKKYERHTSNYNLSVLQSLMPYFYHAKERLPLNYRFQSHGGNVTFSFVTVTRIFSLNVKTFELDVTYQKCIWSPRTRWQADHVNTVKILHFLFSDRRELSSRLRRYFEFYMLLAASRQLAVPLRPP